MAALLVGLGRAALVALPAAAHEIPSDVTVQIIVAPSGDRLRLLVRAPLDAMQDMEFPTTGPGYLDLARARQKLRDAATIWLADDIELYDSGRRLERPALVAARASIPSDRSFAAFDSALAHVLGPGLPASTELVWQQALLDVLFEVPIESERSNFSIRPRLERLGLRVVTVIRFVAPAGVERIFQVGGDPGLVRLDPRWHEAALRFVRQGFGHILDGADHLLFLLCLVIPLRERVGRLALVATAFTVAHSITLIASAYGLAPNALWFPPLVETLIAFSIFYMAVENAVRAEIHTRWLIAFGFGLIHGFGFSFALRNTLQFAGNHVLTSLLSFNVGVELGQLFVLAVFVGALNLLFRFAPRERIAVIVMSVIVAHTAWHWMADRYAVLREYRVSWKDLVTAFAGSGLTWLALALAAAALAWWVAREAVRRAWRDGTGRFKV